MQHKHMSEMLHSFVSHTHINAALDHSLNESCESSIDRDTHTRYVREREPHKISLSLSRCCSLPLPRSHLLPPSLAQSSRCSRLSVFGRPRYSISWLSNIVAHLIGFDLIEAILSSKHQRETPMTSNQELQQQEQLNDTLVEAAKQDSLEDIQSLLDRHANINTRDRSNNTPLHHASLNGHHQCIELLLDRHADIHAFGCHASTPLHYTSSKGNHQCIELLLDRHADINARAYTNSTPLHYTSSKGNHQCIELLLDRHADVNALAYNNYTPLHLASKHGHPQCIELLLDHGADIHARDNSQLTPLHHASLNANRRSIEILLDRGADKSLIDVRLSLSL